MDLKIMVATHKKYWMPDDSVYVPIHVGKQDKEDIGYIGDNTGDNISKKNKNYCELTGIYWAWKNLKADYIGLCHYRRYFTNGNALSSKNKKRKILSSKDYEKILKECAIILPDKRKYYIETLASHYAHSHQKKDLDITKKIIQENHPQYATAMDMVLNRTWAHMFNMFVMRKDYFDLYCDWLFDILFELERRIDISKYDASEARVFGYISELLLDVWIETNKFQYKEVNVSFIERQNWIKKGGIFLKRKIFS